MHDCMYALLSVLHETCVATRGPIGARLCPTVRCASAWRAVQPFVTLLLLATETTASARWVQGEPPLLRLFLRTNRAPRPLIL